MTAIIRKQAWRRLKDGRIVRVMGMAENYVVARIKGCYPFLMEAKNWLKAFERAPEYDSVHVRALVKERKGEPMSEDDKITGMHAYNPSLRKP